MASELCFTKGPSFFRVALVTTMEVDVVFTTTIPFVAFDNEKGATTKSLFLPSDILVEGAIVGSPHHHM
jgi:hypothetical protein